MNQPYTYGDRSKFLRVELYTASKMVIMLAVSHHWIINSCYYLVRAHCIGRSQPWGHVRNSWAQASPPENRLQLTTCGVWAQPRLRAWYWEAGAFLGAWQPPESLYLSLEAHSYWRQWGLVPPPTSGSPQFGQCRMVLFISDLLLDNKPSPKLSRVK